MHRIYFLAPNVDTGRKIVDALLLKRIAERHIHVVARQDTPLEDLPEAHLTQRSDLVPALERGVAAGGLSGLLAGTLAVTFPPAGLVLGGGALLGLTLFGAGFGAWVSGMIGAGLPSSQLAQFESAIKGGQLLVMVDVPRDRVDEIEALVSQHYPQAKVKGTEPQIPVFP